MECQPLIDGERNRTTKDRRMPLDRRMLLGGLGASVLLALPGCAGYGRYSLVDAVRRMLELSADRAFARLLALYRRL